jgi:uncharacterized protein
MIPALARFVAALRAEGVSISPAEIVDASRALDLVGLEDRAVVRDALRATLAKDRAAAAVFDPSFDRFFSVPRGTGRGEGRGRPGSVADKPRPGPGEGTGAGRPAKTEPPRERGRPGAGESERRRPELQRARPAAGLLEPRGAPQAGTRGRLRHVLSAPRTAERPGEPRTTDLARRMTTEEERSIAREVPRMIQALRLAAGRRRQRARTGRPWLRQVLRENLQSGGVPFVIPYRAKRKSRTRVTLLVDVSYSTARAAGLFLLMARSFLALGRRTRVLAFVDRPVDATAAIARWTEGRRQLEPALPGPRAIRARRPARPGAGIVAGGVAFADVLDGLSGLNLEAPSDYGRAFHALLASPRRPHGRDTMLVVLGDGRTNRFDPLAWAFDEIARGCRLVVWLVPEPTTRWGTADSALPVYLPSVDLVAEATDLEGIARGLAVLVRSL